MVYFVSIQSGPQDPADHGARRDAPTLLFEGFRLAGEASPEDVARALNFACAVASPDSDTTDSDTDSTTEPEAKPSPVENALEGFVKVEELVPQAEWREATARKDEDSEEKETTEDERAPAPAPAPAPRADAGTINLVEEVLQVDAALTGEEHKYEPPPPQEPPSLVPVLRKPARRTKTHGGTRPKTKLDFKPRVVLEPPATRSRRRRASVSVNELASDPARAREIKPKRERRPASTPEPPVGGENAFASTPATLDDAGARRKAPRRKHESEPKKSAAATLRGAPARYAVSEPPETDASPASAGGSPVGTIVFASALHGSMPPPPPPPPPPADPAARARDALRHTKVLLDENCISPGEYEAFKRACLERILWG